MSGWYEQAKEKLEKGQKSGKYDRYAMVMRQRVSEKLLVFCKQEEEFAQAVVQGGSFEDCMKTVAAEAAKYGDSGIPDEDAYKLAVSFYFPGAAISVVMRIDLCWSVRGEEPAEDNLLRLNFDDFL